ncbi:MAG: hypothetical protein MI924_36255 [Chloroflexales bacterium]|nr:hypothetical protein [Chloroflexales bacterium]
MYAARLATGRRPPPRSPALSAGLWGAALRQRLSVGGTEEMQKPPQRSRLNLAGLLASTFLALALTGCMPSDIAVWSNSPSSPNTTAGSTQQYFPQVVNTNAQLATAPLSQPGLSGASLSTGGPAQLFMPLVQS